MAAGENATTLHDLKPFLEKRVLDVVQPDAAWCGGVSELVKICTLASVHGVNVIPHGHSLHAALHVVASQPVEICPLVEYLIRKMSNYYYFEKNQLKPVNGMIELPKGPGFGIEFDESKIVDMKVVNWR